MHTPEPSYRDVLSLLERARLQKRLSKLYDGSRKPWETPQRTEVLAALGRIMGWDANHRGVARQVQRARAQAG
jgi:hypothetical protein